MTRRPPDLLRGEDPLDVAALITHKVPLADASEQYVTFRDIEPGLDGRAERFFDSLPGGEKSPIRAPMDWDGCCVD